MAIFNSYVKLPEGISIEFVDFPLPGLFEKNLTIPTKNPIKSPLNHHWIPWKILNSYFLKGYQRLPNEKHRNFTRQPGNIGNDGEMGDVWIKQSTQEYIGFHRWI